MDLKPEVAQAIVYFVAEGTPKIERFEAQQKAASSAIPGVVETLAKCGYITNEQRVKAAESLKDPAKVLDTLQRIALSTAIKTAEEAKTLGSASTPKKDTASTAKTASVASRTSAADEQFLRSFGL